MLSSHVIFVLVFVLVWSALTIWTVYKLNYLSGDGASLSIRYGVNAFGIGMWLVSIAIGVVLSWQINPGRSLLYYGMFFAFTMLPICLWGGYVWGKAMSWIFPRQRNK